MKYVKAKGKSYNDINVEYVKSELASEFYAHTVSFAIAVELYLLYIEDKKLALNKLLKIIKAHSLSSEEYLDLILLSFSGTQPMHATLIRFISR